jgi:hypothetical protein
MCKKLIIVCLILAMAGISYGMTPTNTGQNVAWTGTPTIATEALPSTPATGESFVNGVISETFTVRSGMNTKLDKIAITIAGAGDPTTPYTLRLLDLGDLSGANPAYKPATYNDGADLWGGTISWTFNGTGRTVMEFDFTGAEEVTLTTGKTYAFELTGGPNGNFFWYRGGDDYAYGCMYDQSATAGVRDYIPRGAPRTAGTAVYMTPEPATIALLGLGGLALLRRKRA